MMLKVFGGLKDFIKKEEVSIDGPVFRLHTIFTAIIFLACSLIVTAKQLVGDPIQCLTGSLAEKPVNTFCWIMSTFIIPTTVNSEIGIGVAHPGLSNDFGDEKNRKYYNYYQWVCFVLFFQGFACYFPKWLWDLWEGGLLKTLAMGLDQYVYESKDKLKKIDRVVDYVYNHIQMHRLYAIRYWFCEFLCLLNVFAQMYLMNKFFDGEFLSYGLDILNYSDRMQENRTDCMIRIFPRVTKCDFRKVGPTGTVQRHDILCVLPLNVVNEKIYIVIWFWFMFLIGVLSLLLVYRVCLILCPMLRPRLIKMHSKLTRQREINMVTERLEVGDWWVLYMLSKSVDQGMYDAILKHLARKFEDTDLKR